MIHVTSICKSSFFHWVDAQVYYIWSNYITYSRFYVKTWQITSPSMMYLLKRLQHVQNITAARLLTFSPKYIHITPMLKELHWLPVHLRVEFKILLITFKVLHDCAPVYIKDLIKQYQPVHELRSSHKNLLVTCTCEFTLNFYGLHAFSIVFFSVAEATLPVKSGLPVLKKSPKNPKIPRKKKQVVW